MYSKKVSAVLSMIQIHTRLKRLLSEYCVKLDQLPHYATGFCRLSMKLGWNDVSLMSAYKLYLKDLMKKELAYRPNCNSLDDLINGSIEIDNLFYAYERQSCNNQNQTRDPPLINCNYNPRNSNPLS